MVYNPEQTLFLKKGEARLGDDQERTGDAPPAGLRRMGYLERAGVMRKEIQLPYYR